MIKASLNGVVIAQSDATIVIEGHHYFPPTSVDTTKLQISSTRSQCPWKGLASYYNVMIADEKLEDSAWTYPDPSKAAQEIKDYVAFWDGVKVEVL
jgi:uncharacterized protein (DUF427 family)